MHAIGIETPLLLEIRVMYTTYAYVWIRHLYISIIMKKTKKGNFDVLSVAVATMPLHENHRSER